MKKFFSINLIKKNALIGRINPYFNINNKTKCNQYSEFDDKSNIEMGLNNYIGNNVKIYENVKIGSNNKIYDDCIIYPNTEIGNNNIFLRDNIIGEIPVNPSNDFNMNGVIIGDNNLFHVNNIIFSGCENKTIIGNNNKILAELHMGHDSKIGNNVHIYPRVIIGGYTKLMDYSGIGMGANIHQNLKIGSHSFIGGGNFVSKNIFPFYININNKPRKLNMKRIEDKDILQYNDVLLEIYQKYINNELNLNEYVNKLPEKYFKYILDFI